MIHSRLTIAFLIYGVLTLGSMATMSLGAALLALTLLGHFAFQPRLLWAALRQEWHERPLSRLFLLSSSMLAFALACSLGVGWLFPPLAYSQGTLEIHFFRDLAKTWYLFWPFVLVVGLRQLSAAQHQQIFQSWLTAFTLLSALGIVQRYCGWPRPQVIPSEPGHFHATLFLGHHLSVASIFIFPFFASLALFLQQVQQKTHRKARWLAGLAVALGLANLVATYSRTLWVALPLGGLLWIGLNLKRRQALPAAVSLITFTAAASQWRPLAQRLQIGMGTQERLNLWSANWQFFQARPWFGVGFGHGEEMSGYYFKDFPGDGSILRGHAHNNLLEMLASTGGVGTSCWLFWCFFVFWLLFKLFSLPPAHTPPLTLLPLDPRGLGKAFFCAWLVFQINGLTQVNFWEGKVEHQVAWMLMWSLLLAPTPPSLPYERATA